MPSQKTGMSGRVGSTRPQVAKRSDKPNDGDGFGPIY